MRKSTAIVMALLMLASSLMIVGPGTMNAEAVIPGQTVARIYGDTIDGQITKSSSTAFGSWDTTDVSADDPTAQVMVSKSNKQLSRVYLSFDTSSIPDEAYVMSAILKIWTYDWTPGGLWVAEFYHGSWGISLDSGDWGSGTVMSDGSVGGGGGQMKLDNIGLDPDKISLTGTTQFEIRLANEDLDEYFISFCTADYSDPAYRPCLELTYTKAVPIIIGNHTFSTNIFVFPAVSSYNDTYNLATLEFSTHDNTTWLDLLVPQSWTFLSFSGGGDIAGNSPGFVYVENTTRANLYHFYFTYPVSRATEVHVGFYVSSTGEGIPFETFRVKYSAGLTYNETNSLDVVRPDFQVTYATANTIAVFDHFGNIIETATFLANSYSKYISIPLDIYSLKCFNQQEDFSRIRIYYNNTGAPLTFFLAPMEPVERFVRPGPYTIVVTNYPDGIASESQYFNITVSDAEYFMLDGTTISRVISDVAGVKALQQVITSLVTPDMVFVRENMPSVPTEAVEYIHPWSVLTATTETDGSGKSMVLWLPRPNELGTTYTIISDKLYVSGNYTTDIWVNSTAGAVLYSATSLPSVITMAGQNITVQASESISVHRVTTWRSEKVFYWEYLTSQKLYRVTLGINNTMSSNLSNADWFVGWAENRTIDLASVRVYDVDNSMYLVAGLNYDVTTAGLRMHFDTLPASISRMFRITCYDANSTSGQSVPMIYCSEKVESSWDSQEYWLSRASWTSTYAATYEGQLNIKLDVTGAEFIDPTTVVIVDTASNKILGAEEFFISGNVITIQHVIVPQGGVKNYDVYYKMDFDGSAGWNPWEPLQIVDGFPISWGFIMVFVVIVLLSLTLVDRLKFGSWSTIRASMTIAAASIVTLVLTSGGL